MTEKVTVICESCGSKVEECAFASYKTVIDGRKVTFCCKQCFEKISGNLS